MRTLFYRYARAVIAALALALLLPAMPSVARAAGPTVTVTGTGMGACAGRQAAAVVQGELFDVALSDFPRNPISIMFTFPDGRVLSPREAAYLDGVHEYPPLFYPSADRRLLDPVESSASFRALKTWPTGCYTVSATSGGLKASATLVVQPAQRVVQPGNLKLSVQAAETTQPTGEPCVVVDIFGHNIPAGGRLKIEIVQPNGSTIMLPDRAISVRQGSFTAQYVFTEMYQIGTHIIYATVTTPSGSIYVAKAQFVLSAPAISSAGPAKLILVDPFAGVVKHGTPISIQGRSFTPGRRINMTIVLPNGVRITCCYVAVVDRSGNVTIPPLYLGRFYPTGSYQLIVTDGARTAAVSWRLEA